MYYLVVLYLNWYDMEKIELENFECHWNSDTLWKSNQIFRIERVHHYFTIPVFTGNLCESIDILRADGAGESAWCGVVDPCLLSNLAPAGTLAIKHSDNSRAFVHIPNLQKTAKSTLFSDIQSPVVVEP